MVKTATSPSTAFKWAATPRPAATTIADWRQPSSTCRAVIHTPPSPTDKALPAAVSTWAPTGTTRLDEKGELAARGMFASPGMGGGASGALAFSRRLKDSRSRPPTMAP